MPYRARRLLLGLLLSGVMSAVTAGEAHVAAASSLRTAMPDLIALFSAEREHRITVSYGASGLFARQIERGAPYQLFLSADSAYVVRLQRAGLTADSGAVYALGRLALYASPTLGDAATLALEELPGLAGKRRLTRFAIASPNHAPYGMAARAVLSEAGAWSALQPYLAVGENAAQTVRFLQTGNAEAGLVPMSLLMAGPLASIGSYRPLAASSQPRIEHRMVLIGPAGSVPTAARELFDFLRTPAAQLILERHGFGRAGEG